MHSGRKTEIRTINVMEAFSILFGIAGIIISRGDGVVGLASACGGSLLGLLVMTIYKRME